MVFDGLSFFRDFGIKYYTDSKNTSKGWVSLRCPFHQDHSDHFGFNPSYGTFSCWRCGGKAPLETVKALTGLSKGEAFSIYKRYLIKRYKGGMQSERKKASGTFIELPGSSFTVYERDYLRGRGIQEEQVQKYDLRSGGVCGDWAYRIVFPIYSNTLVVSATGRCIHKGVEPRYWTLPYEKELVHHKHIFYGMDLVDDLAVVVEGPVDALKGGDGFIASFGVDLTDEQLCVLLRYEKVIFLRDNDAGGNKTVEMAYKLSSLGHDDVELVAAGTEYKDIGEMPDDAILDLRKGLGL